MSQSRYVLKPTSVTQALDSKTSFSGPSSHGSRAYEATLSLPTQGNKPGTVRVTVTVTVQHSTVLRGGLEASVSDSAWSLPLPQLRTPYRQRQSLQGCD